VDVAQANLAGSDGMSFIDELLSSENVRASTVGKIINVWDNVKKWADRAACWDIRLYVRSHYRECGAR
jgi:hypothetical protein